MLEIIAWLGVLAIAVKLLIIPGECRRVGDDGSVPGATYAALWIGWIGLIGLAAILLFQGAEVRKVVTGASELGSSPITELSQDQIDCINRAEGDAEAVLACAD